MMLSVIIDTMDQSKTKITYLQDLTNPLETSMVCKPNYLVHGLGYHLFFSTCQVQTRTNLAIEVLRRTRKKNQHLFGFLPPIHHLQLGNASANKSHQFLAFIAYLVHHRIFPKVILSYYCRPHSRRYKSVLECDKQIFQKNYSEHFQHCRILNCIDVML